MKKRDLAMEELEGQATIAKVFARRLWATLARRTVSHPITVDELLGQLTTDAVRIIDPTFDAAWTLYERHRVRVEPCRRIMDEPGIGSGVGPGQPEMYVGVWPDGTQRSLSRAELLMMGGQDPDA